jgi:hypothetical protein
MEEEEEAVVVRAVDQAVVAAEMVAEEVEAQMGEVVAAAMMEMGEVIFFE